MNQKTFSWHLPPSTLKPAIQWCNFQGGQGGYDPPNNQTQPI